MCVGRMCGEGVYGEDVWGGGVWEGVYGEDVWEGGVWGEGVWGGDVWGGCVERMCGEEKNVFHTLGSQAKGETTARREASAYPNNGWKLVCASVTDCQTVSREMGSNHSCSVSLTMQSHRCCDISFNVVTSSCASFNITEHSPYFSCHSETYMTTVT